MARITILIVLLLPFLPAVADEKAPLESRVNRAIERGAAHLVSKQGEDGSWRKDDKVHPLGRTALCTFTLLHAGYPQDHPAVRKALAFLSIQRGYANRITPHSTYEAACLVLLLNALGKDQREPIHAICKWLEDHFNWSAGLWGYPDGVPDMSNTQYAALAMKAGERHGYKSSKKIWKRLVDSSIRLQSTSGGFRYRGGTVYRATMTHAALLVLKFAEEALGAKAPKKRIQAAMKAGHQWLADTYSVQRNPDGRGWRNAHYYYYMYGLERYAVFFGKKEIAGHDWYREGAEELLDRQKKKGGWGRLEETCFAILFLRRATLSEPSVRDIGKGDEEEGKEKPGRPKPHKSVPGIREWLVAGPYLAGDQEDNQLFEETIPVTRVKPVAGGRAGKMKWVRHSSRTDKIDFKESVGEKAWSAYYAAVWLHADAETDAVIWLDSDDGLRAWVDGKEILDGHHHGHCGRDFYRVPVRLAKGRNLLLLHVENLEYYCYFHARVSDVNGKPLPGVVPSVNLKAPRRK